MAHTTRTAFVGGNWKMNTTRSEAIALASAVAEGAKEGGPQVAIFPPFVWLDGVANAIPDSHLRLGAQDCSPNDNGAYTGDVSLSRLTTSPSTLAMAGS